MQFHHILNKKISVKMKSLIGITALSVVHSSYADSNMNFNFTSQIPDDDYKNIAKIIVNPTRFQFMSSPTPSAGKIIPLGISVGGGSGFVDSSFGF